MDIFEIEELALYSAGKTEEVVAFINEGNDIDDFIFETYGVDTDNFAKIARSLIKLTPVSRSELTETRFHAFVIPFGDKGMRAVAKVEVDPAEGK